ncbi:hypothetical protein ACU7M0_38345, partial [Burkholderia cenocepacia]
MGSGVGRGKGGAVAVCVAGGAGLRASGDAVAGQMPGLRVSAERGRIVPHGIRGGVPIVRGGVCAYAS